MVVHADDYCCNTDNDVGGDDSQQGDMLKCHLEVLHVAFDGREKKEMGERRRRWETMGEEKKFWLAF